MAAPPLPFHSVSFTCCSPPPPPPLSFPFLPSVPPASSKTSSHLAFPAVPAAAAASSSSPSPSPSPPAVTGTRAVSRRRNKSKSYVVVDDGRQAAAAILEVQESPDLDSALQRLGGTLRVQDLNFILRSFGNQSRWNHLSQLFEWMRKHNKINVSSYSSYIKFMGKSLNLVKAIEIYNSISDESTRANVVICNAVLGCLIRNDKFTTGITLFQEMKKNGLIPDAITYTTLLAGCNKIKDGYSKAQELVQELNHKGLQIDSVMYGALIAVCATNNRWEEAQGYFDQMKNEGYTPNAFHYSSLLNAYSLVGDYKKAEKLVQDMKASGLVPNKVIMTTLLKVYVRSGLFEKAKELLVELEVLGYAADEMPYCILMDGFAKTGNIDEARSIFNDMMEKCVRSDGYSYSIMISAFCRGNLLEEAKQLAKDFEAKFEKYDLVILNTMLCAYCRAGEMESVMQTMKRMDELAISPDYNTFHILIKYFCKHELYQLAYRTLEDMRRKGHQLEEELCSALIFHLGKTKAHSEAFSVYTMLKYSKRTMCKSLHEKILHILISGRLLKDAYLVVKDNAELISQPAVKKFANAFMKLGNINLINDVIKVVHGSGYKIDQEIFKMAISRYIAQPEKKDLLIQLLRWMPGEGYIVDSSARNLVLKKSHLFGRQLIAEILSKQLMMSRTMNLNK